jgi:hypothetical protein
MLTSALSTFLVVVSRYQAQRPKPSGLVSSARCGCHWCGHQLVAQWRLERRPFAGFHGFDVINLLKPRLCYPR